MGDFGDDCAHSSGNLHLQNNHLSYTGHDCERIPEELSKLYGTKVKTLDLSFNSLHSLRGLEKFGQLTELILDNNQLNDAVIIPYLPHLHTLSLNKNNISNLEDLVDQITNQLPNLTYLSLLRNRACPDQLTDCEKDENDYLRYRSYVLYKLPKLNFLDSRPVSSHEKAEAMRRGKFMKVARPNNKEESNLPSQSMGARRENYTPLPLPGRAAEDHKGAYGKCKYRYSGKHSEGNRFIRNNDL